MSGEAGLLTSPRDAGHKPVRAPVVVVVVFSTFACKAVVHFVDGVHIYYSVSIFEQ